MLNRGWLHSLLRPPLHQEHSEDRLCVRQPNGPDLHLGTVRGQASWDYMQGPEALPISRSLFYEASGPSGSRKCTLGQPQCGPVPTFFHFFLLVDFLLYQAIAILGLATPRPRALGLGPPFSGAPGPPCCMGYNIGGYPRVSTRATTSTTIFLLVSLFLGSLFVYWAAGTAVSISQHSAPTASARTSLAQNSTQKADCLAHPVAQLPRWLSTRALPSLASSGDPQAASQWLRTGAEGASPATPDPSVVQCQHGGLREDIMVVPVLLQVAQTRRHVLPQMWQRLVDGDYTCSSLAKEQATAQLAGAMAGFFAKMEKPVTAPRSRTGSRTRSSTPTACATQASLEGQGQRQGQAEGGCPAAPTCGDARAKRRGKAGGGPFGPLSAQGSAAGALADPGDLAAGIRHGLLCQSHAQTGGCSGELCQRAGDTSSTAPGVRTQLADLRSVIGGQVRRANGGEAAGGCQLCRARGQAPAACQAGQSASARHGRRVRGPAGPEGGGHGRCDGSVGTIPARPMAGASRQGQEDRGHPCGRPENRVQRSPSGHAESQTRELADTATEQGRQGRPGRYGKHSLVTGGPCSGARRSQAATSQRAFYGVAAIWWTWISNIQLGPQPSHKGLCGPSTPPRIVWNHSVTKEEDFTSVWSATAIAVHLQYQLTAMELGILVKDSDPRLPPQQAWLWPLAPCADENCTALPGSPRQHMDNRCAEGNPFRSAAAHTYKLPEPNCNSEVPSVHSSSDYRSCTGCPEAEPRYRYPAPVSAPDGPIKSALRNQSPRPPLSVPRRVSFSFAVDFWFPSPQQLCLGAVHPSTLHLPLREGLRSVLHSSACLPVNPIILLHLPP